VRGCQNLLSKVFLYIEIIQFGERTTETSIAKYETVAVVVFTGLVISIPKLLNTKRKNR